MNAAAANPAHADSASATLVLRLLGSFSATLAGEPIADARWPSLRATHLVQLLALADRRRLARDQVIELLWPQLDAEAGAANLRKAAHYARQALGRQDAVALQGGEVLLAPTLATWIDAVAFEQQARRALQAGDPAACAEAAAAYGGDLLPGTLYESWTEPTRERLRSLQTELLRASGQWEALVRLDPTDEPAHCELIARELAAGNRAAAIRWYGRVRDALQHALGVAPGAQMQALYHRCVDGLGQPGPALVGRELVHAQIAQWLRLPLHARPSGVVVSGSGGIGKTALCREIASLAQHDGACVVSVDAALPGRPYAAVAAACERLILQDRALLDTIGEAARAVLAMLTPLAAPAANLPGPLGRHQVIGAFRRLLLAGAMGRSVMLRMDDAHLLDDADVDVMLHLASAGPPVFVVLAMRPPTAGSALARGVARLVATGALRALELGPLPPADLHTLITREAAAPLRDEVSRHIVTLADGNPFIALELLRCAAAPGARLPVSVAEAIMLRLVEVPDSVLDLLRRLALVNDEFDGPMAVALAQADEARTFAALDVALRAGVLAVVEARYRFRHELVRQAMIEQVAPHRRLKLNREAAQALAELDVAPSLVARLWTAGGSPREATAWWLAAAQAAMRVAAFSDALRHLEPVLAFEPGHAEALRLRAEALDARGEPTAVEAYRRAADAIGGALADDLRAKGALAQVKQGDPKGAVARLQGLQPSTADGRLSEALAYCGAAALGAIDPAIGTLKSTEARRVALQSGDTAGIVIASWAHAAAAHARGELHQSIWSDLHDVQQFPHLAVRVFDGQLCMVQRFLYGARPYAEVIAFAQALADEARRLGAARGHAFGVTIRGEAELLSGDLDGAEKHLSEGVSLHRAIGAATGESFALQRLAEVSMYRGERDQARERLNRALDVARQTDVGFHLLDRIYGTRIALADGAQDGLWALQDAREAVRGPLETCPGCRITFAVPAAIAAARAGDVELAQEYEQQTAYLADVVMRLPAWHAAHDEVRGHLALARGGGGTTASAHFGAAARRFREAGHPLDALRCDEAAQQLGAPLAGA